MSICNAIFGKGIYELELPDIISFFEVEQEETSILEFKSGATELEAIHKEVSAFLNTEGGILIIGAPKERRKEGSKGEKVCVGLPDPCKGIVSQDTLIKSIAANISPSPVGIKITTFDYSEGKIFVIEIPQSFTPPHQCNNEGKYYIRLERDAKAAPHGIVEALFLKRQKPDLRGSFKITYNLQNNDVLVEFSLTNRSIITAESYGYIININGVESLISTENLNSTITFENESITTQNFTNSAILVKGIEMRFKVRFKPLYPFPFMEFSYYCKDMQLEKISGLFEIGEKSEVKLFDSKDTDSKYTSSEINELFKISKESFYKAFFKSAISYYTKPAELDRIFSVEDVLNTKFPESYINFLMTYNGYYSKMRSHFVSLLAIDEIVEASKPARIHFSKQRPIIIGEVKDHGWITIFRDAKEDHYSFGYINTNDNNDPKIVYLGESLIEALKKIMNWN